MGQQQQTAYSTAEIAVFGEPISEGENVIVND